MRAIARHCAAFLLIAFMLWLDHQLSRLDASSPRRKSELHAPTVLFDGRGNRTGLHATFSLSRSRSVPATKRRKRPDIKDLVPDQYRFHGYLRANKGKKYPMATKDDRVIVVGKLESENTDWVVNELPDWSHAIYTVDSPNAPLTVSKNKGKESNVYLQYIIDSYDTLPSTIVFLHSHRDGYPQAWHTEFRDHSNVRSIKHLQTSFVQRNGYGNLRCNPTPGCPDEIHPLRVPKDASHPAEAVFADVWRIFFNGSNVPDVVATPCCSQFAVSREQVHRRSLSNYKRYHQWLMETELPDEVSGRVLEYMWHIIFGREPVYCPDINECYHDVYGLVIGDGE